MNLTRRSKSSGGSTGCAWTAPQNNDNITTNRPCRVIIISDSYKRLCHWGVAIHTPFLSFPRSLLTVVASPAPVPHCAAAPDHPYFRLPFVLGRVSRRSGCRYYDAAMRDKYKSTSDPVVR